MSYVEIMQSKPRRPQPPQTMNLSDLINDHLTPISRENHTKKRSRSQSGSQEQGLEKLSRSPEHSNKNHKGAVSGALSLADIFERDDTSQFDNPAWPTGERSWLGLDDTYDTLHGLTSHNVQGYENSIRLPSLAPSLQAVPRHTFQPAMQSSAVQVVQPTVVQPVVQASAPLVDGPNQLCEVASQSGGGTKVRQLWNKYAQNNLCNKSGHHPPIRRSYYRCHDKNCKARLLVDNEKISETTYRAYKTVLTRPHNHSVVYATRKAVPAMTVQYVNVQLMGI